MDFLEMIIFITVFAIVLFYFSIQFFNVFKINSYIAITKLKKDLNIIDEINKIIKINIACYCVTYVILALIYFLLVRKTGLIISAIAFTILFIMYSFYNKAESNKNYNYKIKVYKIYNFINFIFNLAIVLAINICFVVFIAY